MNITELEEFISVYGKDIYGFCKQLTCNTQEADDLYQDTFLKAIELKDEINCINNPKSYLISISIRIWKNRKRKYAWRQKIAKINQFDEIHEYECISNINVDDFVMQKMITMEEKLLIQKVVSELKDKFKIPIYLYYSAEMSVKDISETLKIPQGTVKSRLHKARKIIKEKLEVVGYEQ